MALSHPVGLLFITASLLCGRPLCQGLRQGDALLRLRKMKSGANEAEFDVLYMSDEEVAAKVIPQKGKKETDKIEDGLPGQPKVPFQQYGGYVTVDAKAGRALFYYFVEAENSSSSRPLLLWLNGGPGCSSLGYGGFSELGPFRIYSDGRTLYRNYYSWNKVANVLFLESPAGVGYSYSNTTSDYNNSGDKLTAWDNYIFLLNWLERFPEYKTSRFFIAGESYAGHYVPQLAHVILAKNKKARTAFINLKGVMIGNAAINDEADNKGMFDYWASHALISEETAANITNHCNFSSNQQSKECQGTIEIAEEEIGDIDIYEIYAPPCNDSNLTSSPRKTSGTFDPCSDYYVYSYLNLPEVQKALHANVTALSLSHHWEACSDVITHWMDSASTVLPLIQELMHEGVPVWIFSGDVDGRVPVTSTMYAIKAMKPHIDAPWRPWYLDRDVGGYTVTYAGGLTFLTVRGAGHQVPSYQPARALAVIQHFLSGLALPRSSNTNN